MMETVLGLPNMGRLKEEVLSANGDVKAAFSGRALVAQFAEIRIRLARSMDLPRLLESGACDAVVTGKDYMLEAGVTATEVGRSWISAQ